MSTAPMYDFEGEYARKYDGLIRLVCPGYDNLFRLEEALLNTMLGEQANLLICGAGGGMEVQTFAPANPNWRFTGVDPSSTMIQSAQAKADANGVSDRVELQTGFVHDLPADMLFDGATCNLVLHFVKSVDEKRAVLQSIYDRLKPGAAFACSSMFVETNQEHVTLRMLTLGRLMIQAGIPKENLEAMGKSLSSEMMLIPEEETVDLLRQVGFEQVLRFHTGMYMSGWVAKKPE